MPSRLDDTTVPLVVCAACRKRLPKDDAQIVESEGEEIYFCNATCLAQWRAGTGGTPQG